MNSSIRTESVCLFPERIILYNNLHKKDTFFLNVGVKTSQRAPGETLPLLPALLRRSPGVAPRTGGLGSSDSDTQVNYTTYCDAIRKKDEMTKRISTRSSAGLCALSHCNPLRTTIDYYYLTSAATRNPTSPNTRGPPSPASPFVGRH